MNSNNKNNSTSWVQCVSLAYLFSKSVLFELTPFACFGQNIYTRLTAWKCPHNMGRHRALLRLKKTERLCVLHGALE